MSRARPGLARLHIVTDDSILERADVEQLAADFLRARPGRVAVHIRGPQTSGRRLYHIASTVAAHAGTAGLFVNDRVDVALAVGCGVHLAGRSLPTERVRGLFSGSTPVGRSIRGESEASGADFAFVGSVYETPSHPGRPGLGVESFAAFASAVPVPVMAIGGISAENIGVLLDAGAYGVAMIRSVWGTPDPVSTVEYLTERLEQASQAESMDE